VENILNLLRLAKERALKKLLRGQKGQALPIVLILLIIGGLLIVPTLNYASTSLKGYQVTERKAEELYAADSGVEYALIKLSKGETTLADYQLNGKTVSVTITDMGDGSYLITSTATSADGSSTTIHTGVSASGGFAFLFDNAITGNDDVTLRPGTSVVGNVTASGTVDGEENVTGTVTEGATIDNWPDAENDLRPFYWAQVEGETPVPDGYTIDISSGTEDERYSIAYDIGDTSSGNLSAAGNLDITGKGVAQLDGTIYVKGDFNVQPNCKIYLKGQTIYAEGSINFQPGCTVSGSGCIIAEGNVNFQPNMESNESDFIFIMSVGGTTTLKPGGDYYGSIAGSADVTLQPGCTLMWHDPGEEGTLNFPEGCGVVGGSVEDMTLGGWDIS